MGRNGKAFTYSVEKGDFSCNNIVSLAFDKDGVLWFKDAEGSFYSYTSFTGFVKHEELPSDLAAEFAGPVEVEEQVPVEPVPEPVSGHSFPSWPAFLLAFIFFALFVWQLLKGRRNVTKSVITPATPRAENPTETSPRPAEPAVRAEKPAEISPRPAPAPRPAVPKTVDGDFAAEVMKIVKTNFTNPEFGVEDVAAALGISRVHLNRKLKAENSPSPSDMIKTMRMELASEMLKAGGKTIAEVAEASGFSSASYFSSAFKEYFGVAPAVYK
ncbi:MAG: helix-turn-helix domain-containing protein [Bacteroidales bacterium]|nr:helix-turn-helix domain-containing protein [Bacteroidales bacterium]